LTTEQSAMRNVNYASARYWQIANPSVLNELGQAVAYKLMPGASAPPMMRPGSAIYDRARFVHHDLWVTAFDPAEKYAAGDYPYQSPAAEGLPVYVEDDASVVDTDVVVWFTVGAHHIVRPEDWPVMPVTYAGFHLKPVGFFDGNPALDLPPSGHSSVGHSSARHSSTGQSAAGQSAAGQSAAGGCAHCGPECTCNH
jgi:primary-amine oxidase